jgi:hypothetical protein
MGGGLIVQLPYLETGRVRKWGKVKGEEGAWYEDM